MSIVKLGDYNSRLDSLQKAISTNSSQIVLAEGKRISRPNPKSSLRSYMNDKITAAYTNRSNQSGSKKKLKSLGSMGMLKNHYESKRNQKYSHIKGAASIQLYGRYDSRMKRNDLEPTNSISSGSRLVNSFKA
jgi:hypothetical protein